MTTIKTGSWDSIHWESLRRGVELAEISSTKEMSCRLFRVQNQHEVRPVSHSSDQIILFLAGEGDYYVAGKPYRLTSGSWITVPAGAEHYVYVYNSPEPCLFAEFCAPASPPPLGELPDLPVRISPRRYSSRSALKKR